MGRPEFVAPEGAQALARRARTPDDRPTPLAPGAAAVVARRQPPHMSAAPGEHRRARAITDTPLTKEE